MKVRKANSLMSFKNSLRVGQPTAMPMYGIHNPVGLKFLPSLRLGLSHLNEYKFKHNFKDCVNPSCSYNLEIESPSHFFLHCHYFTNTCLTLLDDLKSIDVNIPSFPDMKYLKNLKGLKVHFYIESNIRRSCSKPSLVLHLSILFLFIADNLIIFYHFKL